MFAKTSCPISRSQFVSEAKGLEITINGQAMVVQPKEFSTGSFGWFAGEKLTVRVGDTLLRVQLGVTATVIGSKEAPRETQAAAA